MVGARRMGEYRESKTETTRFRCAFFLAARASLAGAAGKLRASPCARGCRLPFATPLRNGYLSYRPLLRLRLTLPSRLDELFVHPHAQPRHAVPRHAEPRLRCGCLICRDHVAWRATASIYFHATPRHASFYSAYL